MPFSSPSPPDFVAAIDLGAKRTGVWTATPDAAPHQFHPHGILLDLEEGGQQWAQAERRAARGQSRRVARRQLAKRLLQRAAAALSLPADHVVFIRAAAQLMNRRGFLPGSPDEDDNQPEKERDAGIPREEFLENIAADICRHSDFIPLRRMLDGAGIHPREFANLAGNIANLPLRVLRRFFRKRGSDWGELRELLGQEIAAWKASGEIRDRRKKCLVALRDSGVDILRWWRETNPIETVPPFESNANRNPPDCSALLICPGRAAEELGGADALEKIADILRRDIPAMAENLADKKPAARNARILQRALDWSDSADSPFRLRRQAKPKRDGDRKEREKTEAARVRMEADMGAELAAVLTRFAAAYYAETEDAKSGARNPEAPRNILRLCGRNSPHKKGVRAKMLAGILRCAESDIEGGADGFFAFMKSAKVDRKGLAKLCEDAAVLQKRHGNRMKTLRDLRPGGGADEKLLKEAEQVRDIYHRAPAAAAVIAGYLGHDETRRNRYADPFSLAQLSAHCEGGAGFASNCRECMEDNLWRRLPPDAGSAAARAPDLPADSVHMLDGMLARILAAQAQRIAAEPGNDKKSVCGKQNCIIALK